MWKTILILAVKLGLEDWAKRKAAELAAKIEAEARDRFDQLLKSAHAQAVKKYEAAIEKADSISKAGGL